MAAFPPPHTTTEVVVVDTDVTSFLFKQDTRASLYLPHLAERILILSAQSRAELYTWPLVRNWSANRRQALERFIYSRFNVEYPDDRLCRLYGELVADARKRGLSLPLTDTWQAATALALGTPLVTHNANNYRGVVNLQLITETA